MLSSSPFTSHPDFILLFCCCLGKIHSAFAVLGMYCDVTDTGDLRIVRFEPGFAFLDCKLET